MADQGSGTRVIEAPLDVLWDLATDVERYPEWMSDVRSAAVGGRDAAGRATEATFTVGSFGLSSTYTVAYAYDPPGSFSWTLVRSNEMRTMDGEYSFRDLGDGRTEVTYRLSVDLKIPMLGMIKRRAESTIIGHALGGLAAEAARRTG
ncbi:MAG: SRPBCC family protein [Microthrixaceae bacterium]